MSHRVLALDLSLSTGHCCGAAGERPVSGVWMLPRMNDGATSLGKIYAALDNELSDAIAVLRPDRVVAEAPLMFMEIKDAARSANTAELIFGLWATVRQACYRADLPPPRPFGSAEVRHAVLGTSRFPKGTAKQFVMAWCTKQGWRFADDNEADAQMVWAYATGFRCASPQQVLKTGTAG